MYDNLLFSATNKLKNRTDADVLGRSRTSQNAILKPTKKQHNNDEQRAACFSRLKERNNCGINSNTAREQIRHSVPCEVSSSFPSQGFYCKWRKSREAQRDRRKVLPARKKARGEEGPTIFRMKINFFSAFRYVRPEQSGQEYRRHQKKTRGDLCYAI
jgi:hypothetical protein